jgi:hypothetical protein
MLRFGLKCGAELVQKAEMREGLLLLVMLVLLVLLLVLLLSFERNGLLQRGKMWNYPEVNTCCSATAAFTGKRRRGGGEGHSTAGVVVPR